MQVTKIRNGLYRIDDVRCGCGGELRVERCGTIREFLWETFCRACKTCDPNGWPTLAIAAENAAENFSTDNCREYERVVREAAPAVLSP